MVELPTRVGETIEVDRRCTTGVGLRVGLEVRSQRVGVYHGRMTSESSGGREGGRTEDGQGTH